MPSTERPPPSGKPPAEALRFFRAKGYKVGFSYQDVWREEHATAFTVAKGMERDVLTSIRQEVDSSLADGTTFRDFKKTLTPRLQKLGWWGRKKVVDPLTGKEVTAQLGSPARLRTIYHANVRTARSAGAWERAQRTKAARPAAQYRIGPSARHRPHHVAWDGIILPLSHPWWRRHWPPNGWGCNCWIRTLSKAELARRGGPSKAPKTTFKTFVNKRSGIVEMVPEGVDPGWDTNPGQIGRRRAAQSRRAAAEAKFKVAMDSPLRRRRMLDFPAPQPGSGGIPWRNEGAIQPAGIHRVAAGFQARPTGDCVLRALANAYDADYRLLWGVARAGWPSMVAPAAVIGIPGRQMIDVLRRLPGWPRAIRSKWSGAGPETLTVASAIAAYGPDLIVAGDRHMSAIVDGAVVDYLDSTDLKVSEVWEVRHTALAPAWRAQRGPDGRLVQHAPTE